jgi:hypothetical protein
MNGQNYNWRSDKRGGALTASGPQARGYDRASSAIFDLQTVREAPPMNYQSAVPQWRPNAPPPVPTHRRPNAPPLPLHMRPAPAFQSLKPLIRDLRTSEPVRPYGVGWFGVFVTWIATMTVAALVSTSLPAHVTARARFATRSFAPVAPAAAPSAPPVAATAPSTMAPSSAQTTTASLPAAAATVRPGEVAFEIGVSELPRASALPVAPQPHPAAAPHRARSHHAAVRRSAAPAADTSDDDTDSDDSAEAAAPAPPPAPAPIARRLNQPPAASDSEDAAPAPAPKPVVEAAPPAPKPAPAATFAPGSLEDLIRKEVAKEQKKVHGTK